MQVQPDSRTSTQASHIPPWVLPDQEAQAQTRTTQKGRRINTHRATPDYRGNKSTDRCFLLSFSRWMLLTPSMVLWVRAHSHPKRWPHIALWPWGSNWMSPGLYYLFQKWVCYYLPWRFTLKITMWHVVSIVSISCNSLKPTCQQKTNISFDPILP